MKYFFLLTSIITIGFSNTIKIDSFEADFKQVVVNDKKNELIYTGHVQAKKPQFALWLYTSPTEKQIYISDNRVTIVEADIEQVIIKHISNAFNFFNMIKNAKHIDNNTYVASFQNIKYIIKFKESKIQSISYQDELENDILITFSNQQQNQKIDNKIFIPIFPLEYDIIED